MDKPLALCQEEWAGKALVRQQDWGAAFLRRRLWLPMKEGRRRRVGWSWKQRWALLGAAVYSWKGLGEQRQGVVLGEAVRGAGG